MLICVKSGRNWKICLVLFLLDIYSKAGISACSPNIKNEPLRDKYPINNKIYGGGGVTRAFCGSYVTFCFYVHVFQTVVFCLVSFDRLDFFICIESFCE